MTIKTKYKQSGYSTSTASEYIKPDKPIHSLSTELEAQQLFEDSKPTGEIVAYKATFVQEGLEPFQVKFEDKVKLPEFLSLVQFDTPSRWAREHQIAVIHPVENRSKSDFVSEINEQLSQCLGLIQKQQSILYDNPRHDFTHLTIVIDEVLALSEGVNKTIKESFFSLLSQIALLGRATKIHLTYFW